MYIHTYIDIIVHYLNSIISIVNHHFIHMKCLLISRAAQWHLDQLKGPGPGPSLWQRGDGAVETDDVRDLGAEVGQISLVIDG